MYLHYTCNYILLPFFIAGVGDPADKLGMHVQARDVLYNSKFLKQNFNTQTQISLIARSAITFFLILDRALNYSPELFCGVKNKDSIFCKYIYKFFVHPC